MTTPPIPKHNLFDKFQGEMIVLWQMTEEDARQSAYYAHRDDYYMFLFKERGYVKIAIDFEEYASDNPVVIFILPEQVHLLIECENLNGWVLIVDKMLVDSRYKEVFQCASLKDGASLNLNQMNDLKDCLSMLHRRVNCENRAGNRDIIHSLLSSYIGIIAEIYRTAYGEKSSTRSVAITSQFRTLLAANYKLMKKPSQYAAAINISSIYLNEIIKKTMGLTVTASIHNEVVVHAKRLLFYTNMNIKEIALELGYEDWAYFTRLFTQIASVTPTQFRAKYLK